MHTPNHLVFSTNALVTAVRNITSIDSESEQERAIIFLSLLLSGDKHLHKKVLERVFGWRFGTTISLLVDSGIIWISQTYKPGQHSKTYVLNPEYSGGLRPITCSPNLIQLVEIIEFPLCTTRGKRTLWNLRNKRGAHTATALRYGKRSDPTIFREWDNTRTLMARHFPEQDIWIKRSTGGRIFSPLNGQKKETKAKLPGSQFDICNAWLSFAWVIYSKEVLGCVPERPLPKAPTPALKQSLRRFLSDPARRIGWNREAFQWLLGFDPGFARWIDRERRNRANPLWLRCTKWETEFFRKFVYPHIPEKTLWFSEHDGFWIEDPTIGQAALESAISNLGLVGIIQWTRDKNKSQ